MTSIYQQALGADFDRLHPRLQERFGFSSADNVCQIGTGVMTDIWRGPFWTLPFLLIGSTRRVLFPSRGKQIPFTISNYAYADSFGRETVTWSRRFKMRNRIRAFDATMILSNERGKIIDYLGTHQHLAVISTARSTATAQCVSGLARCASTSASSGSRSHSYSLAKQLSASGGTTRPSAMSST
jgi:Domain of unknown function (DUF4166)